MSNNRWGYPNEMTAKKADITVDETENILIRFFRAIKHIITGGK